MSVMRGLLGPAEPVVICPGCGADMPLASGWGPVGDKQFRCGQCGELSELQTIDLR